METRHREVTGALVDCTVRCSPSILGNAGVSMHDPAADIQGILKCKWTLLILGEIAAGRTRPSAIERAIPGLSHKMLHERLNKLSRLDVIGRVELAAKAQVVTYHLTPYGRALSGILDEIRLLGQRHRPRPAVNGRAERSGS